MCTEIGCIDGLNIDLKAPSGWPAGSYTFAFELDGAPVTCTGALPRGGCETGPALTCDVEGKVRVEELGCAVPPEKQGFSGIVLFTGPKKATVTISRDGQELQRAELTPTYNESRPNGPDCEPLCRQAQATVTLP